MHHDGISGGGAWSSGGFVSVFQGVKLLYTAWKPLLQVIRDTLCYEHVTRVFERRYLGGESICKAEEEQIRWWGIKLDGWVLYWTKRKD